MLSVLLLACTPPPSGSPFDPIWTPDPELPTRAAVTWDPTDGLVVLTLDDGIAPVERRADAADGRLVLPALPASTELTWQMTLEVDGGVRTRTPPREVTVGDPPDDLEPLELRLALGGSQLGDAWFLTTLFDLREGGASYAVLFDDLGRLRWWRAAPPGHRILRVHRSDDGQAWLWASNTTRRDVDEGRIVREPLDGSPSTELAAPWLHHDFVEQRDGYAFLAWVFADAVDLGDGPEPVATDAIVHLAADGTTDTRFDFFTDWPDPPSRPCPHARVENSFAPGYAEWTHTNSIVRATDDDGWWILPRYLDQVARVRADGTLDGVLGGNGVNTPTWTFGFGLQPALPFAHGHMSQALDDDTILVFDNGDHVHAREGSRVVELQVDRDAGVVRQTWSAPEPFGRFVGYLGDARRLPGGNTLIVNPNDGVFEVDPSGTLLFEAHHRSPSSLGRLQVIEPL